MIPQSGSADRRPHPDAWRRLIPGQHLTIVKLAPDGTEAARYAGEVVANASPDAWVIVRATWTHPRIALDGLAFCPDDVLLEWFSPELPFNAFAVFSPVGSLRGWYANVTRPPYLVSPADDRGNPPMLVWHDMYLDLVGLPGGSYTIRDEDELAASPLGCNDPETLVAVTTAGNELRRRFERQVVPFVAPSEMAAFLDAPKKSSPGI